MTRGGSPFRGAAFLLALGLGALVPTVSAQEPTLEEKIEAAIAKGLPWLAAGQNPDGSWGGGCDSVSYTGLAVLKFETRAIELGKDPLGEDYEYAGLVRSGLDYLFRAARSIAIGPQPAGNPDSDGDGRGIYFAFCDPWHDIYNTSTSMMAVAASGHPEMPVAVGPEAGQTYGEILADAVDFMAWAQVDADCDANRGGWRYSPIWNACDSDNSNTGWVTLGLGYASAAPPWGFGLPLPQWVKNELTLWIDVIQDDMDGGEDDGGSLYTPYWAWPNILKTGNLVYEMGLVGDDAETPRVRDAVGYIQRHWNVTGWCGEGWRDHRQATFTMMKGLTALGIETLMVDDGEGGTVEIDWFAEVAQHLVDTQNSEDGSWPSDCWGDPTLSTIWALLAIEKAVPKLEIPVPLDVRPGSCPNPLNVKEKGVLPVAVLGTAAFDVTQIDPSTIRLAYGEQEVPPLRWSYEDVATPFEPFLDKPLQANACNRLGPDGFVDLGIKFDARAVVAILGPVTHDAVLKLTLTGRLKEELGGTPILGEDVIRIIKQ